MKRTYYVSSEMTHDPEAKLPGRVEKMSSAMEGVARAYRNSIVREPAESWGSRRVGELFEAVVEGPDAVQRRPDGTLVVRVFIPEIAFLRGEETGRRDLSE